MEINILNNQTIKITLTTKDMEKYNITHEILKNNKSLTNTIVIKMLETIKKSLTIDILKNKLFLESFKTKDKGCILYLSIPKNSFKNQKKTEEKTTNEIIAFFFFFNAIKNFCKTISAVFYKTKFKNELYKFNNKLVLIISTTKDSEEKLIALIKEFGKLYGKGKIKYHIIKEHCSLIYKENAIEKIIKKDHSSSNNK